MLFVVNSNRLLMTLLALILLGVLVMPTQSYSTKHDIKITRSRRNLGNWMNRLRADLKNIPIINLAIPGSHNSMTYGINANSKIAPDADQTIKKLYKFFPRSVRRWARTQELTVKKQLKRGIRYFDLRICLNDSDNRYYFTHGLYCGEISKPLMEINEFLELHPDEFIILDCQHFYAFSPSDYSKMAEQIKLIFGDKFYSRTDGNLTELTLNKAKSLKKQILMIYRNDYHVPNEFWDSNYYPTPWANTVNVNELRRYLTRKLENRSPDTGYVSQCVLTPNGKYIALRFYKSIKTTVAQTVIGDLSDWIMAQKPGQFQSGDTPKSNVFIADFINLNSYKFVKIVIDLNEKITNATSVVSDELS